MPRCFSLSALEIPRGPCTSRRNTWALRYFLYKDFEAQVHSNKVHGPFGPLGMNRTSPPNSLPPPPPTPAPSSPLSTHLPIAKILLCFKEERASCCTHRAATGTQGFRVRGCLFSFRSTAQTRPNFSVTCLPMRSAVPQLQLGRLAHALRSSLHCSLLLRSLPTLAGEPGSSCPPELRQLSAEAGRVAFNIQGRC